MAEEDEAATTKKKGGGILIPALLITLIAGGGGAAFGTLVLGPSSGGGAQIAAADKKGKSKDKKKSAKKKGKKGKGDKEGEEKAEAAGVSDRETIIPLPTIVANLNNDSKYWLRLETSIIAKAGTKPISLAMQKRLAQDIFAHIRQSRLEEFEGASGLINLRSDLSDVVRIRTKGRAEEVVVRGMIVE
ncbi:MAG: hypothetical protein JXQ99_05280 [Hyphomicrobiaceae bacterium]